MKAKHLFLTALLLVAGCSLIWSPTATVKKYMAAAQKGDVDTMTQLFSNKAIQKQGLEKIRSDNKAFADLAQRATAASGSYHMESVSETPAPEGKQVSFFYKSDKGTDSVKLVFDLSKEGQAWKIDNIGGAGSEEAHLDVPTTTAPMITQEPPPAPLPLSSESPETKDSTTTKPISAGVLNAKAISLPKPAYPPVARAAKVHGTVVVQVLVDEKGNVVSATAISGHPLLRATCVMAARGAKFTPTKLAGEPVKVTGVINYNFDPE